MNKLHALVRRVAYELGLFLWTLITPLRALLVALLGHVEWEPPAWGARLATVIAPLGRLLAAGAAWVALALILAVFAWLAAPELRQVGGQAWNEIAYWKSELVKEGVIADTPELTQVEIRIAPPARTPIETDAAPRPLVLNFSAAAGPLAQVGKEVKDIVLTPALAGRWVWATPKQLEFTPAEDWPIGVRYTVALGDKSLAPQFVITNREIAFESPRFQVSIASAEFYQDPVQLSLRKAVFSVDFSHPVKPEEFERRLTLVADGAAQGTFTREQNLQKLSVTYDKHRLKATVHSEALPIPAQTASLTLRIAEGVAAQRGGNPTGGAVMRALAIPGLYSLQITELKQLIVTGENGEPETLLRFGAGMAVHEKEMARAVSVWQLPAKHPSKGPAYAWSDPAEVDAAVLKQAQRVALTPLPGEREIVDAHSFKFRADAGSYLLVRVQKGLKSAGGYQLGAVRDEILKVKRFAPELAIMSKGSLLALSGEKKLPILVRDLPGVRVEIGRLLPQQLQHLVTQSQGTMSKPEFLSGITPDNLTERFEKKFSLNLKPGRSHYESIDFNDYLRADAASRRGVFLLSVRGFDPKAEAPKAAEEATIAPPRPNTDMEGEGEGEGEVESGAPDSEDERSARVDPRTIGDSRLVIVTDLGIVAKLAADGSRDVFVQSIASGQPVAGVNIEIWARNGSVLTSQATDASGRARLPSLKGMQREKAPAVLVARKAGDLSFLALNRSERSLDTSRFDVGGIVTSGAANQLRAYLFSDRGIYRPGDTMHIGIVAKALDWGQKLADLPVEAEVVDARGLSIRREKLKLGAGGMTEFSHATQDSSPTGNYTINLNLARDSGSVVPGAPVTPPLLLGSISVKVQEFLPDRMKIAAQLSVEVAEGWVSPKDLKLKVKVQNLFGTPAPQRRVDAHLTLTPAYPAFRSHADYVFFDPQRAKETFNSELQRTETDAQGSSEIALELQRYAQATYQLHVLAKAFEPEGGRSVAAEALALVSDRPYLLGYKADGDLGYIKRGGARHVALIAINPQAKKTAVAKLNLVRLERKVLSVLVKQSNGLYKYESRVKEAVLKEEPYALPAAGATLALATTTPGNFAYALRDADGLELARVNYSVVGEGNVTRSLDRNAELQLSLNKKDYNPGEEIEISIRAPYAGAGLITIERERVYAHRWFAADKTASVQKITLPKDYEGNGYVSVQFTRDLASDEIFMSPLSYAIAPFATSLAKRTTPIKLTAPELVKPGTVVRMRLESKTPTRAVVFAVDEGILQVARYQNPDPLKFFFQKRALEVGTQQTLDLILPEFKKLMHAAAPGGDAEGAAGKHLNPFKRKRDKPVVYWSGIVDVAGSREFSYSVPESFNGALRVMAVAVNDAGAAAAAAKTTVRGDLVLLPNVPLAMTPGDEVEVGVGLANNARGSGKDAPIALTLSVSPGLEIVGEAQQTLNISERAEGSTKFRVRALQGAQAQLGSASVIFTAQYKDAKARLATDVSVRPASAYVTLVQTGLVRGTGELTAQGDMFPNFRRSELAVSSAPWAFSAGLIQYLDQYPHGCTEQITSQTYPTVIFATQPELAKEFLKAARSKANRRDADAGLPEPQKVFDRYLSILRTRHNSDGGFALWTGGPTDLFATVYATGLLVDAREHRLAVPNDLLQRANLYLQSRIGQTERYEHYWRTQTQAAYLLTRQGIITTAALTNLREALRRRVQEAAREEQKTALRRDLGAIYLAASYQLLKQEGIAQELLQPAFAKLVEDLDRTPQVWRWNYYYDPLVHDATAIQLVIRHFPKLARQIPLSTWKRLAENVSKGYFNSHSASSIVLAVDAYATTAAKSAAGKFELAALNRQGQAQPLVLPPLELIAKAAVPIDTARLSMNNQGDLPLFYSWSESGYERGLPAAAVTQGLEIVHEYLDAKGAVISEAQIGDELTVRVRVRATDNRSLVPQVALVDLLPGGLEPVLNAAADSEAQDQPVWRRRLGGSASASSWAVDYADIREDRVVFYGSVGANMTEVSYRVRATNVGEFAVPAAYGEAMYERRIVGRSAAGRFKITPLAK